MCRYRLQTFRTGIAPNSEPAYGTISRQFYVSREQAIAAAMSLLKSSSQTEGVRILDGRGQQVWSNVESDMSASEQGIKPAASAGQRSATSLTDSAPVSQAAVILKSLVDGGNDAS